MSYHDYKLEQDFRFEAQRTSFDKKDTSPQQDEDNSSNVTAESIWRAGSRRQHRVGKDPHSRSRSCQYNLTIIEWPRTNISQINGHGFDIEEFNATVGDIIRFEFWPKNHSVARAEYMKPCQPIDVSSPEKSPSFWDGFHPVNDGEKACLASWPQYSSAQLMPPAETILRSRGQHH